MTYRLPFSFLFVALFLFCFVLSCFFFSFGSLGVFLFNSG